jgi:hypothetical protein
VVIGHPLVQQIGHRPRHAEHTTSTSASAHSPRTDARKDDLVELLVARNPDPDSRLPYLLRLPLAGGMVFRTSGTWPRTTALYCHPVPVDDWPDPADIVDRVPVRSCTRRGAAIDLVLDRARENRSQLVFTTARGRDVVFWQSPRTRKQARPNVRTLTARAAGIGELQILVDSHEQYPYRFANQQVHTVKRALAAGERKSLPDLVTSLTTGTLRHALADLAALPRAAVVVEDRYSAIFKLDRVRPALVADGLAELQVRWPTIAIVYCETRPLAEEWTYRYLAAAHQWATAETPSTDRLGVTASDLDQATPAPEPTTAEVRAWARANGIGVPDRGKLRPAVCSSGARRRRSRGHFHHRPRVGTRPTTPANDERFVPATLRRRLR